MSSTVAGDVRFSRPVEELTLVCRRSKVLFVPTPKVACTSLNWLFARHEGVAGPPDSSPGEFPTREMTIHGQWVNRVTRLVDLGVRERNEVLQSPDWVRFCVTRRPAERVLSGWVNRCLLTPVDEPSVELLIGAGGPDPSLVVPGGADLRVAFRRFVHSLRSRDSRWLEDRHFQLQSDFLEVERFPYTDIIDLGSLDDFLDELRRSHPSRRDLGSAERVNTSPSFPVAAMYDESTLAVIDEIYGRDHERFGYRQITVDPAQPVVTLSHNELAMIRELRERARRTVDLNAQLGRVVGIKESSAAWYAAVRRRMAYELGRWNPLRASRRRQ